MKNLLTLEDCTREEILELLNLADQLKYQRIHNMEHHLLKGKTLGMIFQKASTRTRVSFEVGMYELGGKALFLSSHDLQIGRGEPVCDTARVLSRYLDGIMIRTFEQSEVEDLAKYGSIPVINGLTDYSHPCQVLADLMTIREYKSTFKDLKVTFIGDGNNVCNSVIVGSLKVGMKVCVACPPNHKPVKHIIEWANENYPGLLTITNDVMTASKDTDVFFTDVWSSMGMEGEAEERKKEFMGFQINKRVLSVAKKDAMVLHCLPAHREEEITSEVFEDHQEEIFDEAENRLHAQKAVLVKLLGEKH